MKTDIKIPQEDKYQNILEIKKYSHWWEFVKNDFSENAIFRGHANYRTHTPAEYVKIRKQDEKKDKNPDYARYPDMMDFEIWETKSSFHRQNSNCEFWTYNDRIKEFRDFRHLYERHTSKYFDSSKKESVTLLQMLHLFQHYGLTTPLIDFTKDPEIALYFAFSNLFDFGTKSNLSIDGGNRFITIVEIKVDELKENRLIFEADDNYFDDNELKYNDFFYYEPSDLHNNQNIKLQKGAFLYYDNNEMCIEAYLHEKMFQFSETENIGIKPVVWHIIPYNSLHFNNCSTEKYKLFPYLLYRKKLGCFLFEDLRGIESDLKNSNINFNCIDSPEKCECLQKLKSDGII